MIICKKCKVGAYGFAAYEKRIIQGRTIYIPVCPKCLQPIHQPTPNKEN